VAVVDAYGYYLYASPGHEQVLGYTAEELQTTHLAKIVDSPAHRAAYVLRTISVFYNRPIPFTSSLVARSGSRVHVAGTLQHFREPDGVRYFITSVRHKT
jgi:PAS domain S-box-containing protein